MISATSRTEVSGDAVTTDSVMTSRITMRRERYSLSARRPHRRRIARVAPPTATQLAWRARIESVLRVAGPVLDLVLAAGDRLSRVVDRQAPLPEPVRPDRPPAAARRRSRERPGAARLNAHHLRTRSRMSTPDVSTRKTPEEALAWEAANRTKASIAAWAAAALALSGGIVTSLAYSALPAYPDRVVTITDALGDLAAGRTIPAGRAAYQLHWISDHPLALTVGPLLTAFSALLVFGVLAYLFQAVKARALRFGRSPLVFAAIGAVAYGVGSAVVGIGRVVAAATSRRPARTPTPSTHSAAARSRSARSCSCSARSASASRSS